jgi:hypothetical protein
VIELCLDRSFFRTWRALLKMKLKRFNTGAIVDFMIDIENYSMEKLITG